MTRLKLYIVYTSYTVILALILLSPALINGFPLIFPDSLISVRAAIFREATVVKPYFYSVLFRELTGSTDPWIWLIVQALSGSAALIYIASKFTHLEYKSFFKLCTFILLTSLPLMTSVILPDYLLGLLILMIYLFFKNHSLSKLDILLLPNLILLICVMHLSFILVAACIVVLICLAEGFWKGWLSQPLYKALIIFLLLGFSLAANVAYNFYHFGIARVSLIRNQMLFARLYSDGILDRQLEEFCEGRPNLICSFRQGLVRNSDYILWSKRSSLKVSANNNEAREDAAEEIVNYILPRERFLVVKTIIVNTVKQFFELSPYKIVNLAIPFQSWYPKLVAASLTPYRQEEFRNSLQGQDSYNLTLLEIFYQVPYLLSLAILAWVLLSRRTEMEAKKFILFIFAVLLVNAAVSANLSRIYGRYQLRVAWLPVFALYVQLQRKGGIRSCFL